MNQHHPFVDEMIIVDDGSDDIYHISRHVKTIENIKLYRVKKDYGFNSHGCRNLIMKETENEFIILLDSDRHIHDPLNAINEIKNKKLKTNTLYRFVAHVGELGRGTHESVNDYLISKTHFFSAGGYDEEWIGYRNGDRQFFEQLKFFGKEKLLHDIDIVLLRASSVSLNDKRIVSSKDRIPSKTELEIVERRMKTPEPNKKILTFEWERII